MAVSPEDLRSGFPPENDDIAKDLSPYVLRVHSLISESDYQRLTAELQEGIDYTVFQAGKLVITENQVSNVLEHARERIASVQSFIQRIRHPLPQEMDVFADSTVDVQQSFE